MKNSFEEIIRKINVIKFKENFDLIVAIGRGGIIPASILQKKLDLEIVIMWLNFRDENKKQIYDKPILIHKFKKIKGKRILIVDDVSRSGMTLDKAKKLLSGNFVKTFVLNGKADYHLFDCKECIDWPWNMIKGENK